MRIDEKKCIRIGTRESKLALIQAGMVVDFLKKEYPQAEVTLVKMKTTGDKILDKRLDKIGGKGLFVKELDLALMEKRSDYSVHSLKDLPMEVPEELPVICYSKREDERDVLVLPEGKNELDLSLPIGTSSRRRELQAKVLYPDAHFESIRGNVQTRLRKLDEGQYGAIILAAAGLKRLGLESRISRYFTTEEMIPAAGQGILAIQGRSDGDPKLFEGFADPKTGLAAVCERAFVRALDGGCSSPTAAHAEIREGNIRLTGLYVEETSGEIRRGSIEGAFEDAEELGTKLAFSLAGDRRKHE